MSHRHHEPTEPLAARLGRRSGIWDDDPTDLVRDFLWAVLGAALLIGLPWLISSSLGASP